MILLYVLHHADDLNVGFDIVASAKRKMQANWIAPHEILFGHSFADDSHLRLARAVAFVELAPGKQRNSEGGEIARAHGIKVSVRVFCGKVLAAFNSDVGAHVVASERAEFGGSHGADARNSGHARSQLIDKSDTAGSGIAIQNRGNREGDYIFRAQAEILLTQVPQRAGKE